MGLLIVVVCVLAIPACYLYRIAPNGSRKAQMKPFEAVYIAHRGLFRNQTEAPENSLNAFRLAIEAGYGIEMDVQMTRDHQLVVFHDDTLNRMCGVNRRIAECTCEELRQYPLANSAERIPLLDEVLTLVDGQVPLIVEIKSARNWKARARAVARRMDAYEGRYCIESFNPFVVEWFRKNRPEVLRGQLADNFVQADVKMNICARWMLSNLLMNNHSRPDFIAYNFKHRNQISYKLCRSLFPVENVAWTPRSLRELEETKEVFEVFIFDSFFPSGGERETGCTGGTESEYEMEDKV
jgi:glycerophosphoryl diester phosphodiesterase